MSDRYSAYDDSPDGSQGYDNGSAPTPGVRPMPYQPGTSPYGDVNQGDPGQKRAWLDDNVFSKGYSVDGGTNEIIDPDTGDVVGHVPDFYPTM